MIFPLTLLLVFFFKDSIETSDVLKDFKKAEKRIKNYRENKIKIMIVPGHDSKNSGAEFGNIKEAELNLKLAKKIQQLLIEHKELEVVLSRDEMGITIH